MAGRLINGKRKEFIRFYCTGPDGVRGNGTECYKIVYPGVAHEVAASAAGRLLRDVQLVAEINAYHAEATAQAIAQLVDWKTLAPMAQATMKHIAMGNIRQIDAVTGEHRYIPITDRETAAVAKVMGEYADKLVERAYPKAIRVLMEHPAPALAAMLGVTPEELPPAEEPDDSDEEKC